MNKVLIVEDEPSLRSILAESFKNAGFRVLTAKDGEEGFFITQEEKPDLILLDMIMPKMNGLDMAEKLNADQELATVPIIFLSNLEDGEIKDKMQNEKWEHLVKSDWKISDLIEKVRDKLSIATS